MESTTSSSNFTRTVVKLDTWDIVTVVVYFVLVVAVGLFAMCRSNRGTVNGYFLAGRSMLWLPVGASLFVSNIGSEHFIGLAGSGAAIGIAVGAWEVNALVVLQLLGFFFVPIYITSGVVTMPEYLSKRFGGTRLRVFMAILSLLLYIFTEVSVNLYSGCLFIQQSLGWNLYVSIIGLILITALLTITGGLAAVIYTDTLQAVLMVAGAAALTALSFIQVGGYDAMKEKYMQAVPRIVRPPLDQDCGKPYNDSFVMLREPADPDVPWPGFVFGQTQASIWYWCTDQVIVQRVLAAKSLSHAQGATILAGFIKILPFFLMVLPGLISRILYTDEVACIDPDICYEVCQSSTGCTNIAFPRLVLGVMPTGARGLMMSVMIAALMSDLDSIFNSSSTIFTIDIWKRVIRPKANVREMMLVGRMWVLAMVCLSIAWVPVMLQLQGGQLFLSIQEISGYLSPPVAAVFITGMIWTRFNEQGAFWGMMAGFLVGIIRMIIVFALQGNAGNCYAPDTRPEWYHTLIGKVHFMYFALIIFGITIIVGVVVSLLTEAPSKSQISRVTWWTKHWKRPRSDNLESELTKADSKVNQNERQNDFSAAADTAQSSNLFKRGYEWFCGYQTKQDEESEEEKRQKLLKITSIKQNQTAKLFLQCLLVVILGAGVFILAFFSVPT
ncbi:sodium/myo-inositol cotransporter-like isoform X1 [Clavelina lepadiformis]|uniref:sodium/myo-inositol cotransporter-like isoform X1 n=1 Tax=Clavelina lepadiformis TaxID=159417 RepID=UPI004041CBE5